MGSTGVVGRMLPTARHQAAGFRCFNVSGPREQHKGGMASVASPPFRAAARARPRQIVRRVRRRRPCEQTPDLVCVGEVAALNPWFLRHPGRSAVFDAGSGRAQPFNDVAHATLNAMRAQRGESPLTLAEQVMPG